MKTTFLFSFVLGLIPELLISYFVMKLVNGGWIAFGSIYLGIQVIHLLKSAYVIAARSIIFRLRLKSEMTEGIYSDLVKNNFPNPKEYRGGVIYEDYFRRVSTDTDIDFDTRLIAKEILTIIDTVAKLDGIKHIYNGKRQDRVLWQNIQIIL